MCFSPAASFTAGAALSVMGGASMSRVRGKDELLFASVPLLFGIQQLTEGVIWLSFDSPRVLVAATFVFMFFSHVLWPTLIPLSVAFMEPKPWRRSILYAFVAVGCVVSAYFLFFLLRETVTTVVLGESIVYLAPHFSVTFILSPYTVATCASCLFSSYRYVNFFGIVAFLSALAAYEFYHQTFVSVWCFFAAILSVIVYIHVTQRSKAAVSLLR